VTFCEIIRRGDTRAPAAVPARPMRWSVPLCRDRLIEAADIDRRMTGVKRPRKSGNCHLTTAPHTHEERADWEVVDNLDRLPPTPADRAKAEKVLGWFRLFRAAEEDLHASLKAWLFAEIRRDYSVASKALSAATKALSLIADRLNAEAVPAF
jgi:hypothetical protein